MNRARLLLPLLLLAAAAAFAQDTLADLTLAGSLPDGTVEMTYAGQVTAKGGKAPYLFSIASGLLPPGLMLDPATGTVTGTPILAGNYDFTLRVMDATGRTDTKAFAIAIAQAPAAAPLKITTSSLPFGAVGVLYSATLSATGGTPPYSWSVSGLPAGLVADAGGQISGTPQQPGDFNLKLQVTDAAKVTVSANASLTITPAPPKITTTSLPNGVAGVAYSASLQATGGTTPYTWSASGLPPGLTISRSGPSGALISGTPTAAGSYNITISVTDKNGASSMSQFAITIGPALAISTTSLPNGIVGTPYSAQLQATGGVAPYTWSATGLPGGLTMNAAGQISGTPSTAGNYTIAAQVTDSSSHTATAQFPVSIAASLTITTTSLQGGTAGVPYSTSLQASGGTPPYSWSIASGALPAGLTLNASSGQISGTPSAAGSSTFTVKASDAAGGSATANLTLAVTAGVTLAAFPLPNAAVGQAYSAGITASGGTQPYSFSVTAGSLPPGLSLSAANGQISGTPTTSGTFSFTIRVSDASGATASQQFSITVISTVSVTTGSLPPANTGAPYSQTLSASGGSGPYTWALQAGALPPGFTLGSDGTIGGTPTAAGHYNFTVQVTDAGGSTATRPLSLDVVTGLTITSTSPLASAVLNASYSQALAAIGGTPPYKWSVSAGTLPPGLALDATTGVLSGSASSAGAYTFTAQVTDAASASITKQFSIAVVAGLTVTTASLPEGSAGAPYSTTLAAVAGTSPYTWSIVSGALPAGLSLNAGTGAITGTPAANGNSTLTVQVKDAVGATATKQLSITIAPALAIMTQPALPAGVAGKAYSQTLTASGGAPPYSFAITAGSLPQGLAVAGSGDLTGTPQQAGNFSFTVQVTDAGNATASLPFSLTVGLDGMPAVAITDLPDTASPLQQPQFNVKLNQAYSIPLSGRVSLSFAPDAAVPIDDPAIQFSAGGRTLDFTIPAGATQATFASTAALQTGSEAGTITVTAGLQAGGVDATPSPAPSHSIKIARSTPVIRSVKLVKTSSGFEVWITGYSPSRELTKANFTFNPATGSDLQTTQLELPLADSAKQWFQDSASNPFGSQFTIVQPFTIQGNANAVTSVSVTLSNAQGASAPGTASF